MKEGVAGIQLAGAIAAFVFTPVCGFATDAMMDQVEEVEMVTTAPGKNFQFAVRAGVGYITGEMNEYVYEPAWSGWRLSGLNWDMENILMGKIGVSAKYEDWLTVIMDSWWKLSDGSGSMDDYDWMIPGGDWTHWSNSDADVTSASIFDLSANITFLRRHNYVLHGILGLKRDHFEMVATGGDFIYSVNNFRDSSGSFADIPGITYEQTLTAPYIGLGFTADFTKNINLSGRAIFSPLADGDGTDHHHLRNLVTEDEVSNGNMFAFDISVGWALRHNLVWDFTAGYQRYETTKGDGTYFFKNTGEVYTHKDGVGMDQELAKFSTSLTYSF